MKLIHFSCTFCPAGKAKSLHASPAAHGWWSAIESWSKDWHNGRITRCAACAGDPCLDSFAGIFATIAGHPSKSSGPELAAYESSKLSSIVAAAQQDPEYAAHLPALQSRLGTKALWRAIVDVLDVQSLQWLAAEQVPRLQRRLEDVVEEQSALPEECPSIQAVLDAVQGKVRVLSEWLCHSSRGCPLWLTCATKGLQGCMHSVSCSISAQQSPTEVAICRCASFFFIMAHGPSPHHCMSLLQVDQEAMLSHIVSGTVLVPLSGWVDENEDEDDDDADDYDYELFQLAAVLTGYVKSKKWASYSRDVRQRLQSHCNATEVATMAEVGPQLYLSCAGDGSAVFGICSNVRGCSAPQLDACLST